MNTLLTKLVGICFFCIFPIFSNAQYGGSNFTPTPKTITPDAFQFIKYGEIPVSEYTGVANINIPIFTIKEDDYDLPINLSYHSGGIRVNEEASWVGLGWDIQFGSVVQFTQGKDDFGQFPMDLPDYYYYPYPFIFDASSGLHTYGSDPLSPPYYSYCIFSDYMIPKNGALKRFDILLDQNTEDTEPDIIKANFCGHSIQFIKEPSSDNIIVLNKKGYNVIKIALPDNKFGWKIIVPDGTQYIFEEINLIKTYSSYYPSNPASGYGYESIFTKSDLSNCSGVEDPGSQTETISRIWHLTQIVTTRNRSITFKYNTEKSIKNDYSKSFTWESYSQKANGASLGDVGCFKAYQTTGPMQKLNSTSDGFHDYFIQYTSLTNSECSYLDEIQFSEGKIIFTKSNRIDYTNANKLDKIDISNIYNEIIKSFSFNYDYFVSDYNGTGFCVYDHKTITELTNRLKLNSIQETGMPPYVFIYNSEKLPPKNSYATDYWGFYNGKKDNSSNLPNILRFTNVDAQFYNQLSKISNNNSSLLQYNKACVLSSIQYPTGGKSSFKYELNTFGNYIVPDFDYEPFNNNIYIPNLQTYSKGLGLRIKSISISNTNGNDTISKINYSYEGGRASVPMNFFRVYDEWYIWSFGVYLSMWRNISNHNYSCSSSNSYIPNLLGSGNCVGYDKVTITKTNLAGQDNGKIIKSFTNIPDYLPISSYSVNNEFSFMLPSRSNELENGLIKREENYLKDANSPILVKSNYFHYIKTSNVYYGVKTNYLGFYGNVTVPFGGDQKPIMAKQFPNSGRRDLFGYYPIFGTASLLDSTVITSFDGVNSIMKKNWYAYNSNNLLSKAYFFNSDKVVTETDFSYPTDISDYNPALVSANRLTEILKTEYFKNGVSLKRAETNFNDFNGLILPSIVKEVYGNPYEWTYNGNLKGVRAIITYNQYDSFGNILQTTGSDGIVTSYLWDATGNYQIAQVKGAAYSQISSLNGQTANYNSLTLRNRLIGLVPNAFITTYTYKPLVGISQQTDPNGKTTYYEYDTFGRLQFIKDDQGKIMKKYDYHYSTQN